jgi:hypothetical protein
VAAKGCHEYGFRCTHASGLGGKEKPAPLGGRAGYVGTARGLRGAETDESDDQGLSAVWADTDKGDASSGELREAAEVGLGEFREIGIPSDAAEILKPALMLFINGLALLDVANGGWGVVDGFPAQFVSGTDFDGVQTVEAIEVGDGEFVGMPLIMTA